jgi:hypothetical protein
MFKFKIYVFLCFLIECFFFLFIFSKGKSFHYSRLLASSLLKQSQAPYTTTSPKGLHLLTMGTINDLLTLFNLKP